MYILYIMLLEILYTSYSSVRMRDDSKTTSARFLTRRRGRIMDFDDILINRVKRLVPTHLPNVYSARRGITRARPRCRRVTTTSYHNRLTRRAASRSASDPSSKNRAILIIFRLHSLFFVFDRCFVYDSHVCSGRKANDFIYLYAYQHIGINIFP